jgi:uncharacterized protein YbcI
MREQAVELVQRQTGRKVRAFLSDNSVFPDYAAEVFVLDRELRGGEDPSLAYDVPDGLE